MDARSISIDEFNYILPDEKIARYPLSERDQSRLLTFRNGQLSDHRFDELPALLPPGSLLVFNDTRVLYARLHFRKPSGGAIEIFCLEPGPACSNIAAGMQQQGSVEWKCLVGGAGKWKKGQVLEKEIVLNGHPLTLRARVIAKEREDFLVGLEWTPAALRFADILEAAGAIPLPPYLKRAAEPSDRERYQTVYADQLGSVAAPTAGLHFTDRILAGLERHRVGRAFVTLHVGAGTFKPVTADRMAGHDMHAESIAVKRETIAHLRNQPGKIIAVGTTSARTLETLYWLGRKLMDEPGLAPSALRLDQWEVYDKWGDSTVPAEAALDNLLQWMENHLLDQLEAETRLLIAPGYRYRVVSGLITNFHQPKSTLLLLVAALAGSKWKDMYRHALQEGYRFLSYGDSCLILPAPAEHPAGDRG